MHNTNIVIHVKNFHVEIFVYVTVWLAVVFGINSVSNAGRKIVIV